MSAPLSFQEESPPILSTRVSALRKYFPLNSREYHRSADEYATYLILLEGLFRSLERSAPSMRLCFGKEERHSLFRLSRRLNRTRNTVMFVLAILVEWIPKSCDTLYWLLVWILNL